MKQLRILLISDSFILREGVKTLLSLLGRPYKMEECESTTFNFNRLLTKLNPNMVIAKPDMLLPYTVLPRNNDENGQIYYVGLTDDHTPTKLKSRYDFLLPISEDKTTLLQLLESMLSSTGYLNEKPESNTLSERELTILKYIALGNTNNEIAERLFISTHTVMTHRKNITRKLGIKTVSGLTVYAILNKLIKVEELQVIKQENK